MRDKLRLPPLSETFTAKSVETPTDQNCGCLKYLLSVCSGSGEEILHSSKCDIIAGFIHSGLVARHAG